MSPSAEYRESRALASEIKFVISSAMAEHIRGWARSHLQADTHSTDATGDGYLVTSIYFDTDGFDVFHKTGSYGRSKLRIRRYGAENVAFLERKLRTKGVVAKRRTPVTLDRLPLVSGPAPTVGWPGAWFVSRLKARRLRPICQISYQRTARVLRTKQGAIRLTIDHALQGTLIPDCAFSNETNGTRLLDGQSVLELKYVGEAPVIFRLLAEEFALSEQPFSKYRRAVLGLGLVQPECLDAVGEKTRVYA